MQKNLEVMFWLRRTLHIARFRSHITYTQIAAEAGRVENAVRRFEAGKSGPSYKDIDRLVAAYGRLTETPIDAFWDIAIQAAIVERGNRISPPVSDTTERTVKSLQKWIVGEAQRGHIRSEKNWRPEK